MRFTQYVMELLDSSIYMKQVNNGEEFKQWRATIGDRDIVFTADNTGRNQWEIEFGQAQTGKQDLNTFDINYELTKSGNELQVFSMIKKCIMELVKSVNPDVIKFSANKSDRGRAKMYERLVKKLNLPDYELKIDSNSHAISVQFKLEKVK